MSVGYSGDALSGDVERRARVRRFDLNCPAAHRTTVWKHFGAGNDWFANRTAGAFSLRNCARALAIAKSNASIRKRLAVRAEQWGLWKFAWRRRLFGCPGRRALGGGK